MAYKVGGNVYYAISGTVTITTDNTKVTVSWNISFKDATGRVFVSTGSFVIYNYTAVTKPKTTITDPTPVSAKPTIDNIAPTAGAVGDSVVIAGTNFSTALTENIVNFNGVSAVVRSASATRLVVIVPTSSTGIVTVKVKNSETANAPTFTYVSPPTFGGMTPSSGKAGDVLTIIGTNFSTTLTDNVVKMNGTTATVTAATATQITATVPSGVTTGTVTLTVRGKTAAPSSQTINTTFTVTPPANISAMSPITGRVGDAVVLTGTGFSTALADNVVLFNGTAATVTGVTATTLTVIVPSGATTGLVTLKVKGTDATVTPTTVQGGAANNMFTLIVK